MSKFSKPSVTPGRVQPVIDATADKNNRLFNWKPEERNEQPVIETEPIKAVPTEVLSQPVVPDQTPIIVDEFEPGQSVEPVSLNEQELEQRERERVPAIGEIASLEPSSYAVDSPVEAAMLRAGKVGQALNEKVRTSVSEYKQSEIKEVGFDEATRSQADPDKFIPAKKNGITGVNLTSLIFDPDILDAGKFDEQTGRLRPDPELGKIMSIAVENFLFNRLIASDASTDLDDTQQTVETDSDTSPVYAAKRISKSQGSSLLGREIYETWMRQKALNDGLPTDTYVAEANAITPETFTLLGDLAKETYHGANPELLARDASLTGIDKGQVDFILTPLGQSNLNALNDSFKALFATKEVPPQNAPTGQLEYEGQRYTRKLTTVMDPNLGDLSLINESTKNYNSIGMVNDPNRETLSFMFAMQAILNADASADGGSNYYADMFEIGNKRLAKAVNQLDAYKREFNDPDITPARKEALLQILSSYNPAKVVAQEREQMFNLVNALSRYDDKINYITYAIQALTGRTHVQQTLYNPQSHKIIRSVVGSGNVFSFRPRSGSRLENSWKDIIAARILEDPSLNTIDADGTDKLTTSARLNLFDKQRQDKNSSYWTAVAYGQALMQAQSNFDTVKAKQYIQRLANSKSLDETRSIKQELLNDSAYTQDPLGQFPALKKILAGHDKEAPMYADYYMDIAKYENSIADNKPFDTSINVELDGRTHGPATNAALIGVYDMAKRAGLLRDQDYYATDLADLRDEMGVDMLRSLDEFQGTVYPADQQGVYKEMLELAIADRKVFLKKSPMTMGYGQEIESLKQHVKQVVETSKSSTAIQELLSQNNIAQGDAVNFLHTMLVNSIFNTLSGEVIAAGRVMKANALYAQMTDIPLIFTNAMGFKSYAAGRESFLDKNYSYKIENEDGTVRNITTQFYGSQVSGSAPRQDIGPGGYGGRIQAIGVQSYDGNMIARTGTGTSFKRINEEARANGSSKGAFMIPIFDAFITDLGSFEAVRRESNKNWADSIRDHSYIISVADDWYKQAEQEYAAKMTGVNGNIEVDWAAARDRSEGEHKGLAYLFKTVIDKQGNQGKDINLTDAIKRTQRTSKLGVINDVKKPESAAAYQDRMGTQAFETRKRILKLIETKLGFNPRYTNKLTNKQIYDMTKIVKQELNLGRRNSQIVEHVSKQKAKIFKEVDRQRLKPANIGL